jgi:hypothetical protein
VTDPVLPTDADAAALQRRRFLRGGALLAAAAGGAVASAAAGAAPATAADSTFVSASVPVPPTRFLDTRTAKGREGVVRTSSKAFDSKHRLKKGAWVDVAVFPADVEAELIGVYVNLGSRSSSKKGALLVTEPDGGRSSAWTLHYGKNAEVNNSAFAGVGTAAGDSVYVVRIYASTSTHVVLDLTGVSIAFELEAEERSAGRSAYRAGAARVRDAVRSLQR